MQILRTRRPSDLLYAHHSSYQRFDENVILTGSPRNWVIKPKFAVIKWGWCSLRRDVLHFDKNYGAHEELSFGFFVWKYSLHLMLRPSIMSTRLFSMNLKRFMDLANSMSQKWMSFIIVRKVLQYFATWLYYFFKKFLFELPLLAKTVHFFVNISKHKWQITSQWRWQIVNTCNWNYAANFAALTKMKVLWFPKQAAEEKSAKLQVTWNVYIKTNKCRI